MGAGAWAVEQAVLRHIREEMSLSHFLTADQTGAQGGWTSGPDIRSRGGGCITCGYQAARAKQLHDPDQAEREMRGAGYLPLEPYPGADHRWRCRHMPCEREVTARLSKIRRGEGALPLLCPPRSPR